jgi:hypothetical protein
MTRVWGHAVPDTPTDKGWRACYRATSTKCLMWDMSYLMVVEVMGNKEAVLEKMNRMTDRRTGSVFTDGPGGEECSGAQAWTVSSWGGGGSELHVET